MARQLTTKLTGSRDNLSFYKMYDTYYARTKSPGGKQTERTKARQKDFAVAASLAKSIRIMLHAAIPYPKQRAMQNRLVKTLMEWQLANPVQEVSSAVITKLIGFQFVQNAQLQNSFSLPVTINDTTRDTLQVIIPAFIPKQSIKAPQGTKQIHLSIAAGSCSTTNIKDLQRTHTQILIAYNNKSASPHIIGLPVKMQPGTLTVAAISLSFWVKKAGSTSLIKIKQNTFSPAAVIYAVIN